MNSVGLSKAGIRLRMFWDLLDLFFMDVDPVLRKSWN